MDHLLGLVGAILDLVTDFVAVKALELFRHLALKRASGGCFTKTLAQIMFIATTKAKMDATNTIEIITSIILVNQDLATRAISGVILDPLHSQLVFRRQFHGMSKVILQAIAVSHSLQLNVLAIQNTVIVDASSQDIQDGMILDEAFATNKRTTNTNLN
jgi:hypothetical protein